MTRPPLVKSRLPAGCAEGLIHRYFNGKAGLLPALMEYRVSREVADLARHIRPAPTFEDEYLQLVNWAVEHMWQDREFLRVAIPQALLDPGFGQMLRQVGPLQRARAIGTRLKKFSESQSLPEEEFDALVQAVSVIGFMFGFMRPAVLRQDRKISTRMALAIAKLLVRNMSCETRRIKRRRKWRCYSVKTGQNCTHSYSIHCSLACNIFLDGFLAPMILTLSIM